MFLKFKDNDYKMSYLAVICYNKYKKERTIYGT